MKRRTVSQLLHEADPNLNIIPGGVHHWRRRNRVIKLSEVSHIELSAYVPHPLTDDDWNNSGGLKCPVCEKEVVRLLPYGWMGTRKACPECIERRRALLEYKSRVVAPRFRKPR